MSDQIKTLTNSVKLVGKLAELEKATGTTKNGVDYISLTGVVQYGNSPSESRRFKMFCQETTSEGKESKLYTKAQAFYDTHCESTIAKVGYDNACVVSISGRLDANDYYSEEQQDVVQTIQISASFINKVGADEEWGAFVTVEAYIRSIKEEVVNDKETGRLIVSLITTNFRGEAVCLTKVIVDKELAENFTDEYEVGQTAKLYLKYVTTVSRTTVSKGGIGKKRVEDKTFTELTVEGGETAMAEDSKNALTQSAVKIMLSERETALAEIKNNAGAKTAIGSKSSTKGKKNTAVANSVDDDEVPF